MLADKLTDSSACGADKFCCSVIRVRYALRRREHLSPDKLVGSAACETDKFHIPSNRVCPPQERKSRVRV